MKKMHLFGLNSRKGVETEPETVSYATPEDVQVGDVVVQFDVYGHRVKRIQQDPATVVAVMQKKITYRLSTGQYSMLPGDFIKVFRKQMK